MSLVCQRCQQAKATVHITDTIPDKVERHLCEDCAEKEGIIIKQQNQTTNEILQKLIKHKAAVGAGDDVTCPQCGMTFREFQLKGQLGCSHDYEVFDKFLTPLIEQAHQGATQHVGKVPTTADETIRKQTGLLRLRRELQDAVEQENYELAARVRDQIQALESA
jgi:protein arginine kinase activator